MLRKNAIIFLLFLFKSLVYQEPAFAGELQGGLG
jgi:hypothetical protein